MPELFKRSGYHTVLVGKISHTADGRVYAYNGAGDGCDEVPNAWTEMSTPYGTWKRGWGIFFAYANGIHREDGSEAKDLVDFTVEGDDDLPDGQMAAHAVSRLKHVAKRDKPFFMGSVFSNRTCRSWRQAGLGGIEGGRHPAAASPRQNQVALLARQRRVFQIRLSLPQAPALTGKRHQRAAGLSGLRSLHR